MLLLLARTPHAIRNLDQDQSDQTDKIKKLFPKKLKNC